MIRTHILSALALVLTFTTTSAMAYPDYRTKTSPAMIQACGKDFVLEGLPKASIGYPIVKSELNYTFFSFRIPAPWVMQTIRTPAPEDEFENFALGMASRQEQLFVVFLPPAPEHPGLLRYTVLGPQPDVYANGVEPDPNLPKCHSYINTWLDKPLPEHFLPDDVRKMLKAVPVSNDDE